MLDVAVTLAARWRLLVFGPLLAGLVALGIAFIVPPTFTARTVFLPPQQQQSLASAALASLGALSSYAGAAAALRSPGDQYVALLQSVTVADRIIEQFDLMTVYERKLHVEARRDLAKNLHVTASRREGLITVEFDDTDPKRAAAIANRHVEELRRLTGQMALTEAQERRAFFEVQLARTRDRLTKAQQAMQDSGYSPGALKAEPKAAAEAYAKLRAELTGAEVRLQTLRRNLADSTSEVQLQSTAVAALREQVGKLEANTNAGSEPGYVGKYREFKYQETLFDLFARQYELARVDESKEGALIQVVDVATPPEKKSRPARALTAIGTTAVTFVLLAGWLVWRLAWSRSLADPAKARQIARLRAALRGG
jgi:uncharacterized protein involved in exopolysaccharide biosynthesis